MKLARKRLDRRALMAGLGGVMAGTLLTNKVQAGSLEPPGPPAPTGVALDAVAARASRTDVGCANPGIPVESLQPGPAHLYAITQPGYFVLTRNLFVPAGMGGIAILASDVYLDLWGFHIIDNSGGGIPSQGIYCDGENITINDGDIRGFGTAVDMEHATRSVLWDVDATGPSIRGVVMGSFSECCDCNVHNSPGGVGFELRGQRTLLHECMATGCSVGFLSSPPAAVANLAINNVAMGCTTPYSFGNGVAFGPIANCVGLSDISPSVEGRHPLCNMFV